MKHDEIFERLEPPPGGLGRLRARLVREEEKKARARRVTSLGLGLVFAALSLVLFFTTRRTTTDPVASARLHAGGAEVALGLATLRGGGVVVVDRESRATTAIAEVQTTNPNVAFYWVSSTQWNERRSPDTRDQ
jgi:hypothetical protein